MCWEASLTAAVSRATSPWCWQEPVSQLPLVQLKYFHCGHHFDRGQALSVHKAWHNPAANWSSSNDTGLTPWTINKFPIKSIDRLMGKLQGAHFEIFLFWTLNDSFGDCYICSKRSVMLLNASEMGNKTQTGQCFCFISVKWVILHS